jgi:hypothetical protein
VVAWNGHGARLPRMIDTVPPFDLWGANLILCPGAALSAHIHSDISLVTRSAGFPCCHLTI